VTTAGLVLAAGAGRRYGQPKAPVVIDGERLVDRAVRVLRDGGCDPVLVILGAWQGEVSHALTVENPDWAEGMGSSLRVGLTALTDMAVDEVVVTLVDLPGLTSHAVERIVSSAASIVQATYHGERGHPVKFAREHWSAIATAAEGDAGARSFLKHRSDIVCVEVGDIADGRDLDAPSA
jgi:nicotine blue oxidoreductase